MSIENVSRLSASTNANRSCPVTENDRKAWPKWAASRFGRTTGGRSATRPPGAATASAIAVLLVERTSTGSDARAAPAFAVAFTLKDAVVEVRPNDAVAGQTLSARKGLTDDGIVGTLTMVAFLEALRLLGLLPTPPATGAARPLNTEIPG